ncbi:uncharacterized protein [Drosophila tropicalis]|uniref:uncharacterized protein n=1 Tax=Drosophila tropicalis TaxID=46794 RepID=UPI0035AB69E9
MSVSHRLREITDFHELKELQKLYLKDWPKHCVGYFWLDNYLRWMDTKHLSFYTLDNNWQHDGLFILVHRYQLFFGTLNDGGKRLQEALSLLDWSGGYKVSAIQERHHMIYKDLLNELPVRMDRELNTDMYYLSCEEAKKLQINCPNGYYFDKVRPELEMINNLWSARHPGSLRLIELLITKNTNVGLYEKDSGKLCAWCLRLQSGFLGALEVLKTHQRRGLGLVVAAAISRLIAQQLNQDVTALVNMNNISAGKIFQKLNFQLQQEEHYFWSMSLPKDSNAIKWPANE